MIEIQYKNCKNWYAMYFPNYSYREALRMSNILKGSLGEKNVKFVLMQERKQNILDNQAFDRD